jgi:hypothetical protein
VNSAFFKGQISPVGNGHFLKKEMRKLSVFLEFLIAKFLNIYIHITDCT